MSREAAMTAAVATSEPAMAPVETATPAIMAVDSDRFAKLAAREAKFVKEREQFKSEQQQLYDLKNQLLPVKQQYDKFKALKEKDPVAALREVGFTEADIFNFMAEKPEVTAEQKAIEAAEAAANAKIKAFEDAQAKKASEEMKARDSRAIDGFKQTISKSIEKDAEKYEFCAFEGPEAEGIIYETVLEIMKIDKDVAPHKAMQEAMELTEKYYREKDEEMGKKLKSRQPKEPVVAETKEPSKRVRTPDTRNSPMKPIATLTQKAAPTVTSTTPAKTETREQKRERLENVLRNLGKT